jgi:hypothetical protein
VRQAAHRNGRTISWQTIWKAIDSKADNPVSKADSPVSMAASKASAIKPDRVDSKTIRPARRRAANRITKTSTVSVAHPSPQKIQRTRVPAEMPGHFFKDSPDLFCLAFETNKKASKLPGFNLET